MKPDISLVFYKELINTFDNLLNYNTELKQVSPARIDDIRDEKCLKVVLNFAFSNNNAFLNMYVPESHLTKLEYHILNELIDQKDVVDYETQKIVFEMLEAYAQNIVANVEINHDDIEGFNIKTNIFNLKKVEDISTTNHVYCFELILMGESINIYFEFSDNLFGYVDMIKNGVDLAKQASLTLKKHQDTGGIDALSPKSPITLYDLIGEETKKNLGLLFDVKLKLSVRLGSRTFLLKDIVDWDMNQVIELDQMADEPLEILVNNVYIGSGEAVVIDGKFGIKINYIGTKPIRD